MGVGPTGPSDRIEERAPDEDAPGDRTPDEDAPGDRTPGEIASEAGTGWRSLREFGILAVSALVIAIVIKTLLVQAFFIPSGSMEPTLMPGDRILVNRLAYRFGHIEHGDVIVFADPTPTPEHRGPVGALVHWLAEGIGVVRPSNDDFIKRVIALPGETWEIRGGVTFVDGKRIEEPYVNHADPDTRSFGPETVPDGMLFVLGDNRNHSGDSRFPPPSGLGYIPIDKVIGQAFAIIWPPSRAGWIH